MFLWEQSPSLAKMMIRMSGFKLFFFLFLFLCCGFLTISEQTPGTFEICEVCGWEDDNVQATDPAYSGGANHVSLNEGKNNFNSFGAISKDKKTLVRKAYVSEYPDS